MLIKGKLDCGPLINEPLIKVTDGHGKDLQCMGVELKERRNEGGFDIQ